MESKIRKISALLAKAEHPLTGAEEAATFRAGAERLMREYRVAEESLIAQDQFSIEPILVKIDIADLESPFHQKHSMMFHYVAAHTGVRYTVKYRRTDGDQKAGYYAAVVGYPTDIRYAELLFNAARLVMISKLEPKVDRDQSDAENIYRLRSAGIDRQRIAELVWGKRGHQEGLKVGRLYKEACAAKDEDVAVSGRQVNAKTYREVYAREFVSRFASRLREARDAADSTGGALQLFGRAERVDEAFYKHFPEYRPTERSEPAEATTTGCAACARTKHSSGKCRDHRAQVATQADRDRWERLYYGPAAQRATAAGHSAADEVQLSRVERARRVENSTDRGSAIGM